jgi:antitoxin ParD1/3/4
MGHKSPEKSKSLANRTTISGTGEFTGEGKDSGNGFGRQLLQMTKSIAVTQIDIRSVSDDNKRMAVRTSLNVSLTPELNQFIQERVAKGRYQTASEVVREGLRLLENQERDRETAFAALKTKLERAAAQADRGEFIDPDKALKKIDALKRRRKAEKA